jgi:hypothetical protein
MVEPVVTVEYFYKPVTNMYCVTFESGEFAPWDMKITTIDGVKTAEFR